MRALLLAAFAALLLASAAQAGHPGEGKPEADASRGVVYDGLTPARAEGPCAGVGYEFTAGLRIGCTHGPDPAPEGVDVREAPTLAELREGTEAAAPVPCIGDGTSGPRVQAVYAYPSDAPSRFATYEPLIQGWAAEVGDIVRTSSFGTREVRFVTASGAACRVDVREVAVSPAAATSFGKMIGDLAAQGLARSDRKYLVWMDATQYCGIADMYPDERPTADNRNNGLFPGLVARVDSRCWNATAPAHELVHTLGGVQRGAPNGTAYGHCDDEFDLMCYADGAGTVLTYPCLPQTTYARRLDCGGDDYFNVVPTPGSWLATHWNTANSAWLEGGAAPLPPVAPSALRQIGATESSLDLDWPAAAGAATYRVYLDGNLRAETSALAIALVGLACGRAYEVAVESVDPGGATSGRTRASASTRACPDVHAPGVRPQAASGKRGRIVRLRYVVFDASSTREQIMVFRGRTRLKVLATAFRSGAATRSVAWRLPRTGRGPYRFCVTATDLSGNVGATRCAAIRLA